MLTKPRLLLVDDQPEVLQTYARVLERDGLEVGTASDGESALTELYAKQYDIVVTDLSMPPGEYGGIWLVTAIRRVSKVLPIVILSGKGTVPQAVEAMKKGASDYMVKDEQVHGDSPDLLNCISGLLGDSHQKDFAMGVQGNWIGYESGIRLVEVGLRELVAGRLGGKVKRHLEQVLTPEDLMKVLRRASDQTDAGKLLGELALGQLRRLVTDKRAFSYWNNVFASRADIDERLRHIVEIRNKLVHVKGEIELLELKQVELDVNVILLQLQKTGAQ